uniref:Uncharacterized protein n=1 Tax=Rhizophora mucronata TaxID=61149 RepID=A0A2P2QLG1_RHIMU
MNLFAFFESTQLRTRSKSTQNCDVIGLYTLNLHPLKQSQSLIGLTPLTKPRNQGIPRRNISLEQFIKQLLCRIQISNFSIQIQQSGGQQSISHEPFKYHMGMQLPGLETSQNARARFQNK